MNFEQPERIVLTEEQVVVVAVGQQGPPGKPAGGESGAYLQAGLRLAEFNTPEAKAAARANLELQNIDCGTFN